MKSLGEAGEIEPETDAILLENDVTVKDFSPALSPLLPGSDWRIPESEFAYRMDLRSLRTSFGICVALIGLQQNDVSMGTLFIS